MRTRPTLILPELARCVFCDRYADEWHHVAGRNHCGWFVVPLCTFHHRMVTKAEDAAGTNRHSADSQIERIKRARQQCLVFLWLLDSEEMNQ
jgi:hypothetical protein